MVLLEDAKDRAQKIKCMCLKDDPRRGDGHYVPDDTPTPGAHVGASYRDTEAFVALLFQDESQPPPVARGVERWCDPSVLPDEAGGEAGGEADAAAVRSKFTVHRAERRTAGSLGKSTAEQRLFTTNSDLQKCQRQSHRWHDDCCYVDAPLQLVEFARRWQPPDAPPLPVPAPMERNAYAAPPAVSSGSGSRSRSRAQPTRAQPMSSVRVDMGTPLTAWLAERDVLHHLPAPLSSPLLVATVKRLGQHRDDVRAAYHRGELTASSDAELQQKLAEAMRGNGTAGSVLERLLKPASGQFLRVAVRTRCPEPSCRKWQRRAPDFSQQGVTVTLKEEELHDAGYRPILALAAKLAGHAPSLNEAVCGECNACSAFDLVPICAATDPLFILLELPDKRKDNTTPYALEPAATHELVLNSVTARYRLIGVLLYSGEARIKHYIADVFDQRDGVWLRFDGNAERGVGVPVPPAIGTVQHDEQDYFPVALLYGCCGEPAGGGTAGTSGAAARGAAARGAATSGAATPPAPLKVTPGRAALVHEAVTALCGTEGGTEDFELGVLTAELNRLVAQRETAMFSEAELLSCLTHLETENKLMWRGGMGTYIGPHSSII